jgi:hypothetical protein
VEDDVHLGWVLEAGRAGKAVGVRFLWVLVMLTLSGCASKKSPPHPAPTPTTAGRTAVPPFSATPSGPWAARPARRRSPLPCPASSSRAGWPSRVLALGDGSYAKLRGRRPRYAAVDRRGRLHAQVELGARKPSDVRAFACWRQGRTAAAWTERRGDGASALRVALRPDGARTADVVRPMYDEEGIGDVALAFAPDGTLMIVYAVFGEVRAVTMTADGRLSEPVKVGPALERTQLQAEIASGGRVVIAWTTIDAGEERNERRRVYAVTGRVGALGPPQRVDRARHLNLSASTRVPVRLAVASNGRAALLWGTDRDEPDADPSTDAYIVRTASATPEGRFGRPRTLATAGLPGDVAVRRDGSVVALWTTADGLRANTGHGTERVAEGRTPDVRASVRRGRPHVEWRGGVATRR